MSQAFKALTSLSKWQMAHPHDHSLTYFEPTDSRMLGQGPQQDS